MTASLKVSVPKDRVDAALKTEIERLKRENERLKRKLDRIERKWEEHKTEVQEVRDLRKKFQSVIDEYSDHSECGYGR